MQIRLTEIPICDVVNGYSNNEEEGVFGYGGKLNIRPKYQREYIYPDADRNAVIDTVKKEFPLNVMYWIKNSDNTYEVMDGQQRTISICEYVKGNFSINYRYFHNLTGSEKEQILSYRLMVYICEGTDKEKLDWFRTINIAGMKLTEQELRNAVYTGEWLTQAKRYFSKTGCPAYNLASGYFSGTAIRQEYLETILKWIANRENCAIEEYMAQHQYDKNINDLRLYFENIISWVKMIFPNYRKEMKGIDWGILYNKYKEKDFDATTMEEEIIHLMQDDDVTKKSGIYPYLLSGDEKYLNIRTFKDNMKRAAYERQAGICTKCLKYFEFNQMEGDHITPWHLGGRTVIENCQMLCKDCNRRKSGK